MSIILIWTGINWQYDMNCNLKVAPMRTKLLANTGFTPMIPMTACSTGITMSLLANILRVNVWNNLDTQSTQHTMELVSWPQRVSCHLQHQHLISEYQFEFRILHFPCSSLLMCLQTQQKLTKVSGSLSSMWEIQMQFWAPDFSLARPPSADVAMWGVNQWMEKKSLPVYAFLSPCLSSI